MQSTSAHNDRITWAKVIASKDHAETTNIAKRMGKMDELKKGMALLEKMRPVIGGDLYADQVRCLYAALPNFKGGLHVLYCTIGDNLASLVALFAYEMMCGSLRILWYVPTYVATSMILCNM
jgi:hypothetical protein